MNCTDYEILIAQSLDGEPDSDLQRHLDICPACRELARELSADRSALNDLDEIPALALSELRNRVMAQIPSRSSKLSLAWRVAAVAAAVVIAALLLRVKPGAPVAPPEPPSIAKVAPSQPQAPQQPVAPPIRHVSHPRAKRPAHTQSPEQQPLMVKLETSDPNVVIYWTVDRQNGELE